MKSYLEIRQNDRKERNENFVAKTLVEFNTSRYLKLFF